MLGMLVVVSRLMVREIDRWIGRLNEVVCGVVWWWWW